MGNIGMLSPQQLEAITPHRLKVDISSEIDKLNFEVSKLMLLLDACGKEEATQHEFHWLTKERIDEFINIQAIGGAWGAGAASTGTINIPNAERFKVCVADVIAPIGTATNPISETNLYVNDVGAADSGGAGFTTVTARTVNGENLDLSAATVPSVKGLHWRGNSFELGSGMGTIRSSQPEQKTNYIQVIQTPYGHLIDSEKVEYDAGKPEPVETEEEAKMLHQYTKELTAFFGQKHKQVLGYQNSKYEQYFTGGLMEAIETNVTTESELTQAEFGDWVNESIRYAKRPVIFAGERIFEGLSWWLGQTLQTQQDESTLGIAVSTYKNEYGQLVKIIPHREVLRERFAGYAFAVDLDDMKYKYLKGLDTTLYTEIQQPDLKLKINEFRTWLGFWIGNEKRHGVLKDVETIAK